MATIYPTGKSEQNQLWKEWTIVHHPINKWHAIQQAGSLSEDITSSDDCHKIYCVARSLKVSPKHRCWCLQSCQAWMLVTVVTSMHSCWCLQSCQACMLVTVVTSMHSCWCLQSCQACMLVTVVTSMHSCWCLQSCQAWMLVSAVMSGMDVGD